jgi:putative Mn2+ efflux pump MntP
LLSIVALAVALGADAFAVSVMVGTYRPGLKSALRVAAAFGLFQFFMPMLGWAAGFRILTPLLGRFAEPAGGAILAILGVYVIAKVFLGEEQKVEHILAGAVPLLVVSVAESIDAFCAGLTLGTWEIDTLTACSVIGITAALMSLVGVEFGKRIGVLFGEAAQVGGGLILIAIAIVEVVR